MPQRPKAAFWTVGAVSVVASPAPPSVAMAGVTSAYGRTGDVVGAEGDYTVDQLSDVDTSTTPPATNNLLSWNGTNWVPEAVVDSGTFP